MALYHAKLGLPTGVRLPYGVIQLVYSEHAKRAAFERGITSLPDYLDLSRCRIIEVETDGRKAVKVVYRLSHNERLDLVIVVLLKATYLVKTVWVNDKNDSHKTLCEAKYEKVA